LDSTAKDEFDELDDLVDSAASVIRKRGNVKAKFPTSWEMIRLMLEEVGARDVVTCRELDQWKVEVKYRNISFFALVTVTELAEVSARFSP